MSYKNKLMRTMKLLPIPLFVNLFPSQNMGMSAIEPSLQVNNSEASIINYSMLSSTKNLLIDSLEFVKKDGLENRVVVEDSTIEEKVPNTPQGFIDYVKDIAIEKHNETGIPASVMIAQAAIETGWGKYVKGNNFFGIKGNYQNSKLSRTKEFIDGEMVPRRELFKVYQGIGECFDDYSDMIANSPQYRTAMKTTHNPSAFIRELHNAGYASDPDYVKNVRNIMKQHKLHRFDIKNNEYTKTGG